MAADTPRGAVPAGRLAWLFELPPRSDRTLRMEALIARLRLVVLLVNASLLAVFLDTSHMHLTLAWIIVALSISYAAAIAALQPYRRWRVFQTSIFSAALDSVAIMAFIVVTGGDASPYFPLYYLSIAAVAMRFDLRQALVACCFYALTYAVACISTWSGTSNEFGLLALRGAYMFIIGFAVGHLAREENTRSRQVDVIEKLNAENARLLTKTERAARFDRLTGLLNRGYLEKEALKELRKVRHGGYVSVLFCDMDKLKRINDELGHDAGDRVLRGVGSALRHCLRSQDIIGRYGGDEFVVVLPNQTRETAYDRAEALIDCVRGVNESLPEDLYVGLSVGIATMPFDAQDYITLVKVADQAMYLAKREGGNRVRTSNDLRLFWEEMPAA
jgi:diguanylate cyclase (GGDEF)-like protein